MTESIAISDRQALEALLIDNPDLEQLKALLDQFNIFEAVGVVRQELRHSDFLAFLLDPSQPHGLGDTFATHLLQQVLREGAPHHIPITPLDLDLWELDTIEVRREWRNIDILLLDEAHRIAIIVENKVGSSEHSEQLQRYWQIVEQQFPTWHILGLYLTPDGDPASDERYLTLSYDVIHSLLSQLVESHSSRLGPDVRTLIRHYVQMLRRHVMSESEIAELCRRIYRKHQRALDLIFEHRPDFQAELRDYLEELIRAKESLIFLPSGKTYIRFTSKALDRPSLRVSEGWLASGHILVFEFVNAPDRLKVKLTVGPGPQEFRSALFKLAKQNKAFSPYGQQLSPKFHTLYQRQFLAPGAYDGAPAEDLKEKIKLEWQKFLQNDLPRLEQVLEQEQWIWHASDG